METECVFIVRDLPSNGQFLNVAQDKIHIESSVGYAVESRIGAFIDSTFPVTEK